MGDLRTRFWAWWWGLGVPITLAGCISIPLAPGAENWRDDIGWAKDEVFFPGAGDDQCSLPGVAEFARDLVPVACCYPHDAAYEFGRFHQSPEHDRLVADSQLFACVALEGLPQWHAEAVYQGVRLGGWYSWHFGEPRERITDDPGDPSDWTLGEED